MPVNRPSLEQYLWENIHSLEKLFTKSFYNLLSELKNTNSQDSFNSLLSLINEIDEEQSEKLNIYYNKVFEKEIKDMNISEIADALEITPYDLYTDKRKYMDRALEVLHKSKDDNEEKALLLNNIAEFYRYDGKYKEALPLFKESLKIREQKLGKDNLITAQSYHNLAKLHYRTADYPLSLSLNQKALIIHENILGTSHQTTADIYNNLGLNYMSLEKFDKSKSFYEQALKIHENILGLEHPTTANTYNILGNYYNGLENFDKSKSFHEKALVIYENILGLEHPSTANTYRNLGSLYMQLEDFDKAKNFYDKALKTHENILGLEHPTTADTYNKLGSLYKKLEDFNNSKFFYKKTLHIYEKTFGENSLYIASVSSNIAGLYSATIHNQLPIITYEDALSMYKKSLKISTEVLGAMHSVSSSIEHDIGVLYNYNNEKTKAIEIYEKSLKKFQTIFGVANKKVKIVHGNLDSVLSQENKLFFLNSNNSNKKFHIDKIKIKNFKQLKDFEMEFPSNINIIIGQNASGKTSLLQAITLSLLKENSFDSEKDYTKYITKSTKDESINESNLKLFFDDETKNIKILRDKREIDNNYFIPFVLTYGSNFFTRYEKSEKATVNRMLTQTVHKEFANSIFQDYTDSFSNPLTILESLNVENENEQKIQNTFLTTINDFLETFTLVKEDSRYFFQKENDDTQLLLEDLSEGYRGNILLITDMLVKILGVGWTPETIEGIVMIDEFDKHLHPTWQSKLVSKLADTFPKMQFILTTHNPMSILDRNPEEITILQETENGLKAIRKDVGTKKIGVSTILLEYFGVKSTVSDTMKQKIDAFTKLKLKNTLTSQEEKELEQLESFLDQTVATNFIYNKAYFKFLLFLKENKKINFEKYEEMSDEEMETLLEEFKDIL